jgi:DNA-directed RNA polymerase subunit M/transcription elongation factor TFIIS
MPLRIACESCGSRLNVPDALAGRKVKCPKCGGSVRAVNTAVTPASSSQPQPPRAESPKRKRPKSDSDYQTEPDELAEVEVTRKEDRPRRKKKKRRPQAREDSGVPSWVWWIGGVAGFFAVALVAIVLAAVSGAKREVVAYGVVLLIMLPISTVILILSMIISSALAGGIEFGEVHIVIPKALILLLVVNLISLLPLGGYLALPFWVFGLMALFKLDFWEARFLFLINWGLNLAVRIFLVAAILSAMQHANNDDDKDLPPMRAAPALRR